MPVDRLDPEQAASLRSAPLSFTPRTRTAGTAADGFSHLRRSRPQTRSDFDGAARDLFEWRMHATAGLRVEASDVPLREGTVVCMRWGPGALSLKLPCRVLAVTDEPRRRGFTYATLPGHPEAGEERFLLEHLDDERIRLTIEAYSRPASTLAKLGGPFSRLAQHLMTRRYLHALDRL